MTEQKKTLYRLHVHLPGGASVFSSDNNGILSTYHALHNLIQDPKLQDGVFNFPNGQACFRIAAIAGVEIEIVHYSESETFDPLAMLKKQEKIVDTMLDRMRGDDEPWRESLRPDDES